MKKIVTILVLILVTSSAFAQQLSKRHEIGIFGGTSYYIGDLTEQTVMGEHQLSYGLVYRFLLNDRWAFRLHALRGSLVGDDKKHNKAELQYRNLSFKSSITEFSAMIELNFMSYVPGSKEKNFSPYLFGGVGLFSFNPKAKFEGTWKTSVNTETGWYELQPLGTEGQGTTEYPDREPYALTQISIPFGMGIKWNFTNSFSITMEWGMRKTFTDYLDDVSTTYVDPELLKSENTEVAMFLANRSFEDDAGKFNNQYPIDEAKKMAGTQRGNSENDDWYSFLGLTLSFNIKGARKEPCPAYKDYSRFKDYYLF